MGKISKKKINENLNEELPEKTIVLHETNDNIPKENEAPINFENLFGDSDNKDFQQKIVEELLNDNNIDKKTELNKPISFAVLTVLSDLLEQKKLPNSNKLLNNFIQRCYRLLLSKDRKSRSEYIEALKNLKDKDELEKKQNLLGIK